MNTKILIGISFLLLVATACAPKNYDSFAQCLTSKNVTMYGAYWCPHCQEQKAEFGKSFVYVPYVECDAQGENGKPELCKQMNITGYPTWIISGIKVEGALPMSKLSSLSGCSLS